MDTVIYWFSGTGNSLAVARGLANGIPGATVVPIAQAVREDVKPLERVGVVFPVYFFGPPLLVVEFLKRLPVKPGAYIFSVATYGGMVGAAHARVKRILAARGIALAAGWSVRMPGNNIGLYAPPLEADQAKMFSKAEAKIQVIAEAAKQGRGAPVEDSPPPASWMGSLIYRLASPRFGRHDRKFRVSEACNGCGLCEKVCPVANIRMVERRPQWQRRCQVCYACIQFCPTEAIQLGKHTQGRKRYRHPSVTAGDLCARSGE